MVRFSVAKLGSCWTYDQIKANAKKIVITIEITNKMANKSDILEPPKTYYAYYTFLELINGILPVI